MANYPDDLLFSKEHLWARQEKGGVRIGVSEYFVDGIGRVSEVELPEDGDHVDPANEMGSIVGSKGSAQDLFSPVSGVVVEINEALFDTPRSVSNDCYDEGWLCLLKNVDEEELGSLLTPDDYSEYIDTLE